MLCSLCSQLDLEGQAGGLTAAERLSTCSEIQLQALPRGTGKSRCDESLLSGKVQSKSLYLSNETS